MRTRIKCRNYDGNTVNAGPDNCRALRSGYCERYRQKWRLKAHPGAGRRDTREEDGGGEAHHNESRLRRQAERGGAGQCTSHSRPRSRRNPTPYYVCIAHRGRNAVAERNIADCNSDWDHRFFGIYGRARRRVTSIPVRPRLFIARHCDGQAISAKIMAPSFLLSRNIFLSKAGSALCKTLC